MTPAMFTAYLEWKSVQAIILGPPQDKGPVIVQATLGIKYRDVAIKLWAASGVPMMEICDE